MSPNGGRWPVTALAVCVAVLLAAGGWSALAPDTTESTTVSAGGRAGATGFGQAALLDEEAPAGSVPVTVAPPTVPTTAPAPATTTTTRRATTAPTTTKPAPAGGPASPSGLPWPDAPKPTGIPNVAPTSSWSDERDGVSARLRLDPPAPVAGQPVRFIVDYSSAEPCCTVMLHFGDGTEDYQLNNDRVCGTSAPLKPGPHRAVATHTYAGPGSYKANLFVVAGDGCANPATLANGAPQLVIHAVAFDACVGVGPGPAAQKGCSPFPPFGPDTLLSPTPASQHPANFRPEAFHSGRSRRIVTT
jgi:hypothetical protein